MNSYSKSLLTLSLCFATATIFAAQKPGSKSKSKGTPAALGRDGRARVLLRSQQGQAVDGLFQDDYKAERKEHPRVICLFDAEAFAQHMPAHAPAPHQHQQAAGQAAPLPAQGPCACLRLFKKGQSKDPQGLALSLQFQQLSIAQQQQRKQPSVIYLLDPENFVPAPVPAPAPAPAHQQADRQAAPAPAPMPAAQQAFDDEEWLFERARMHFSDLKPEATPAYKELAAGCVLPYGQETAYAGGNPYRGHAEEMFNKLSRAARAKIAKSLEAKFDAVADESDDEKKQEARK